MFRLGLRNTLAHKARFLLTTLAVVMGVGFVVGSFVVTDSLSGSVDQLFADITRGTDVSVRATTELDESVMSGSARGRIEAGLLPIVEAIEGVAAAEGQLGGYAQLLDRDGQPLKTTGAPFIGVSWGHVAELTPATMNEGRAPRGIGEIAIDRGSAEEYGFGVGDVATVLLADGSHPQMTISGIFTFGEANNLLGARLTAFDLDVAPTIFGSRGQYDSISVVAEKGVASETLATRLTAALPKGVEAVTGAQVAEENRNAVAGMLSTFQNVLLGFGAVSLFVSAFFINNTFSIVIGQRTRELALLRSIAATPAQVMRSVLGEAVVVGGAASALGVGFGVVIATGLRAILRAAGFGLPDRGNVIAIRTIVAALVVGLGVTVLAAMAPARRASTVPPVDGIREGFVMATASRTRRIIAGAVSTGCGAGLVFFGLYSDSQTSTTILCLASGAVGIFMGVAQLSPAIAVPVANVLGRPVAPLFRIAGRLAHNNAVRNADRTAKTASALMIGLALVTTVFIVGTSMKKTFTKAIEGSVAADFVVSTGSPVGFSPAITNALAELPELDAVTGVRMNRFLLEGRGRDLIAVEPEATSKVVDLDMRSGKIVDLDNSSILIHKDPARDLNLNVGDRVTAQFGSGGKIWLRVAGIYNDATNVGNYVISMGLFERYYETSDLDLLAFARIANGVDVTAARDAVEQVLTEYPQVTLQDRAEFQASQEAQFDSLLIAVNGLLGLALFIALLGIGNTLALSVLERTREIGLLRAVGMVRRQVREMILAESAMIAVFGAVLGVGVGLAFGVVATSAMPPSLVGELAVPYKTLAIIVVVAALSGIGAGLLPARRAARLDVLRAIGSA